MMARALTISPDDAEMLVSKVKLLQTTGDLPAAKDVLARIPVGAAGGQAESMRAAILLWERNYGEAVRLTESEIAREKSITPGDVPFSQVLLGDACSLGGNKGRAQEAYLAAKAGLEALRSEQPKSPFVAAALAFSEAGLGDKEAALREGERAVSLIPSAQDPVFGPGMEEALAGIEARVGESDRAIKRLARLLTTPYGAFPITQIALRFDPTWDPLRSIPAFQALVEGPEPQTIYE